MFRKILVGAAMMGAVFSLQAPAQAGDVRFGIQIGSGYASHDDYVIEHPRYHAPAGFHHDYGHGLSERELRHHLRNRGLYNIRFTEHYRGIVKVVADNRRGYVGAYTVDRRTGEILDGEIISRHGGYHKRRGW